MKKIINLLSGITLILALTACGTSGTVTGKSVFANTIETISELEPNATVKKMALLFPEIMFKKLKMILSHGLMS